MRIAAIPLASIRRPLQRVLDESKVADLMESIAAEGQKEPIDVLELDWFADSIDLCVAADRSGRRGLSVKAGSIGQA